VPALTPQNDLVRARNVTASEVYALLDPTGHPYTTPATIWDRICHQESYVRPAQTEEMVLGIYFEPYIARYAASRWGLKVRANKRTLEHDKVGLAATPDYYVLNQRWLIECKLSSKLYAWESEDTLQPYVEWQARAQLAVTKREVCVVAALVGSAFHTVPVIRDLEKEERLLDAVHNFWSEHIILRQRPPESERDEKVRKVIVT
jgi:predicted phage-related endonuclease